MASKKRYCHFYNSSTGCSRGSKCLYLHEKDETSATPISQSTSTEASTQAPTTQHLKTLRSDDLQQWLYQIPRAQSRVRPLATQLSAFFKNTLKLTETDADTRQEVVEKLASDGGLLRLDEVVEVIENPENFANHAQRAAFRDLVLPLFEILSSELVKSSFVLEKSLGTILNYLFGLGGRRATSLFGSVCKVLEAIATEDEGARGAYHLRCLHASLSVFRDIVEVNSQAVLIPELEDVADVMARCLTKVNPSINIMILQRAQSHLNRIQRRFGQGTTLTMLQPAKVVVKKAEFHLQREAPGILSHLGPRHDNDFEDIKQIRIMPTSTEVQSNRSEYLPTIDPFEQHVPGIQGLLDRHFRLLREDSVGQLRDAVKIEFERHHGPASLSPIPRQQARTHLYEHASLSKVRYHKDRGLELAYEFAQPRGAATQKSAKGREDWWKASKRLEPGALVYLLDARGMGIFCSVSWTGLASAEVPQWKMKDIPKNFNVYDDAEHARVLLSVVDMDEENVGLVLDGFIHGHGRGVETLVELPGVLLASFAPTLKALQHMMTLNDNIPFSDLLAPATPNQEEYHTVSAPAYTAGNFRFTLGCLVGRDCNLTLSTSEPFDAAQFEAHSSLDSAQAFALVSALTKKLALIQGPPGTGKSYTGVAIMKVLLENRDRAKLGPILVTCYTNHALDQLLMSLVKADCQQIVRVGSRSKQEELEQINLRVLAQKMDLTKTERQKRWQANKKLESHVKTINQLVDQFGDAQSLNNLRTFLEEHHPQHAVELFSRQVHEEGWQVVQHKSSNPLQDWLHGTPDDATLGSIPRPVNMLLGVPVHSMSLLERRTLYQAWIRMYREILKEKIINVQGLLNEARNELDKARKEIDLRVLSQAHVIGVTTSGLARIVDLLGRLNSKVLLCEEAGEVLEAHTLITLLPSVEHCILIGDQQQLRPHIQNYNLSSESADGKQYSFDTSLFERLVVPHEIEGIPKVPFSTLEVQRRMHPSIAELVRATLYPHLKDAGNVKDYPEVAGMRKRLFWLDHRHLEARASHQDILFTSHSNVYEVEMTVALVQHLVKQSTYRSDEIAILTPYLGQLRKLRQALSSIFAVTINDRDVDDMEKQGIELEPLEASTQVNKTSLLKSLLLSTIDNFQGEEADVVILSLVRSNVEQKVGFLRTPNRINVALSRARHGMYIIGNAETATTVPMWAEVISILHDTNCIGDSLELCCSRHPDVPILVKEIDDFSKYSPEGGCDRPCDNRLACGHMCKQKCHSSTLHDAVVCLDPCMKSIPGCSEHPCPKACGKTCPVKCKVIIPEVELRCGHLQDLPCYQSKDLDLAFCQVLVDHTITHNDNEHTIQVQCGQTKTPDQIVCTATCESILPCGHACRRPCAACRPPNSETGTIVTAHGPCQHPCQLPYSTCKHSCVDTCHVGTECQSCTAPCEQVCVHSACKRLCSEPCIPCSEPCVSCPYPCGVPCSNIPSSARCKKSLTCGHQCPSLASEECPNAKYCQMCCSDELKETQVDFVSFEPYEAVDLNSSPIIVPACGHLITTQSLDGHMDLGKHYEIEDEIIIAEIKASSEPFSTERDMKRCPTCRGTLRNIQRYSRIVRRAHLDESSKRFIVWAQKEYVQHEGSFAKMEELFANATIQVAVQGIIDLSGSPNKQFAVIARTPVFAKVYSEAIDLRRALEKYAQRVDKEQQPYNRVRQMVEMTRMRKKLLIEHMPDEIKTVQLRHSIEAMALLLRFDLLLINKLVSVKQSTMRAEASRTTNNSSDGPQIKLDLSSHVGQCDKLIIEATESKRPAQQADGNILAARFIAMWISVEPQPATHLDQEDSDLEDREIREDSSSASRAQELRAEGLNYLTSARKIINQYPGQCQNGGRLTDIEATERMLTGHFYSEVTNEERRAVVKAMSEQMSGSGHWYTCTNGHPFVIDACGMPMERARCGECGAGIGGSNHVAVEGVRSATGLEAELAGLLL